ELSALCEASAPFGGVYVTHMRRYDPDGVLGSMDEVFRIGQEAGCAVHISHFNSRADLVLPHFDAATQSGLDATYDLYCYLAGSTILGMIALPPWVQEGGIDATMARLKDPAVGRTRAAAVASLATSAPTCVTASGRWSRRCRTWQRTRPDALA